MFTYILDLFLVGIAAAMLLKGRYGVTRQIALAPLGVALLDVAFAAQLDLTLTPALSVALGVLQVIILAGSALIFRRDRVLARTKLARRQRRREIARTQAVFEQAGARRTVAGRQRAMCA